MKIKLAKGSPERNLVNNAISEVRKTDGKWLSARGVIRSAAYKINEKTFTVDIRHRKMRDEAVLAIHRAVPLW